MGGILRHPFPLIAGMPVKHSEGEPVMVDEGGEGTDEELTVARKMWEAS